MKKNLLYIVAILFLYSIKGYSVTLHDENLDDSEQQYNVVRGTNEELLSYYNDVGNYRHMVFLKFDLSNITDYSLVEEAKLKLYGLAEPGGGINSADNQPTPEKHSLAVYNMNEYQVVWHESTFMYNLWNYAYGYAREPLQRIALLENITGEGWFEWDITEELKMNVLADEKDITLSICDTYVVKAPGNDNTNSHVRFHSKENASHNKPTLQLKLKEASGLSSSEEKLPEYQLDNNELTIINVKQGSILTITDISGKNIEMVTVDEMHTCTLPGKGVYILSLKDKQNSPVQKILVK